MHTTFKRAVLAASVVAVSGCTITEDPVLEGLTLAAGDAIAHNNSLQRIDPWPPGVQDSDLVVPAKRPVAKDDGGKDAGYEKSAISD